MRGVGGMKPPPVLPRQTLLVLQRIALPTTVDGYRPCVGARNLLHIEEGVCEVGRVRYV